MALLNCSRWLTDSKSGYHQVPMHPDTYQCLGLEIAGRIYVMPFLPSGVASACREYTKLMSQVYGPLRLRGEKMAFLIDDAIGAATGQGGARYHALTFIMVLSALGFYLSIEKCLLDPALRALFLGLLLDSQQCMTWGPEDKIQYFLQQVMELRQAAQVSPRQVAKAAGLLLSFKPAMKMVPLYARDMFQATSQHAQAGWDSGMAPTEYMLQELQWWTDNVHMANGLRWHQHRVSISTASDASESRYAAFQVDAPSGQPWRMEVGFSREEQRRVTDSSLHSTLRELRAIRLVVQALAAPRANQLQHSTVQWFSDSQLGVPLLRATKGAPDCLQEVRLIYQMAMQLDMDFSWEWRPWEDPMLFRADEYSKDDDFGDINVRPATSRRL